MTQKSVSIRANVTIRGVTIRAYALYKILIIRIINKNLANVIIHNTNNFVWGSGAVHKLYTNFRYLWACKNNISFSSFGCYTGYTITGY